MELLLTFLQSKLFSFLITIAVAALAVYIVRRIFARLGKIRNSVYTGFVQGIIEAIIVIMAVVSLTRLSTEADTFVNTIVMSSSVIVVVLGFIFQEETKNIIHGFFISIYKPFEVGDRIRVTTSSKTINGYVETLTLRHTVVRDCVTNVRDIIPNCVLDELSIENFSRLGTAINSFNAGTDAEGNLLSIDRITVRITYDSDLDLAREIMRSAVAGHPNFVDPRKDRSIPLGVPVTNMDEMGVTLAISVPTADLSKLYGTLCDVREQILREFQANGIHFADNRIHVSGDFRS